MVKFDALSPSPCSRRNVLRKRPQGSRNDVEAGHKWSSDHGVRHRRNGKVAEAKSVAHNILKYGAYNRPNFYVRLLNGLAEPPGKDSKMGPRELQNALSVVEHIDYA